MPGIGLPPAETELLDFDALMELNRLLVYDLPALALVLFLFLRDKKADTCGLGRPRSMDALHAVATFGGLYLISALVALPQRLFPSEASLVDYIGPRGLFSWSILTVSCLASAYLEEVFFRASMLSRMKDAEIPPLVRLCTMAALFSLCHLYEGVYGMSNALAAGLFLGLLYERSVSVHALAVGHALYNLSVYLPLSY